VILLARHGETDDNVPPQRVQGWIDAPLNERGRDQARELAAAVKTRGVAAVYSSHLSRARETAEIVAGELGLELAIDERLAESRRARAMGCVEARRRRVPLSGRRVARRARRPGHRCAQGRTRGPASRAVRVPRGHDPVRVRAG
jgi:broad specificity phosphatase PhoE